MYKKISIHLKIISCFVFYENYLISGSFDCTIKVFDCNKNYKFIKNINIHNDYINCLLTYNNLLISGSKDKNINILNIPNKFEWIKTIKIHSYEIKCLILNKSYLISSSFCKVIAKTFLISNRSSNFNDFVKIINLKNNEKIINLNEILFYYYNKMKTKIFNNIKIESIYNLLNNNDDYTKLIIINQYLKINIYIIKYTDDYKLLKESLNLFGYDKLFYSTNQKENIIDLIINEKKLKIFLSTIINYFKENQIDNEIDYEKFIKILKIIKDDLNLFNIFFSYIFRKSKLKDSENFKKFINLEEYYIIRSNNNKIDYNKFKKVINTKSKNNKEYIIYNFEFKFSNKLSKNKELFYLWENSLDEIKLSIFKYIVNFYFDQIYIFKSINLLIFILLIISWMFSLNLKNIILIIIYLITIIYFTVYEIIQIVLNFKLNFKNLWNYFDILIIFYNFIVFFIIFNGGGVNLYIMLFIYLNGLKLLYNLKSWDFLRKQIRLFIKVLFNTVHFMIFILIILLYLSSIHFLFNYNDLNLLFISIFEVYGMMLGNFEDNYIEYLPKDFIELFVNTYLFNIILLNLFISIIANIFENYNKNKELYDVSEKISLLSEYSTIYSVIENFENILIKILNLLKKKKIKLKINSQNYYFLVLENKNIKNDNLKIENLDNKIDNLKKELENKINIETDIINENINKSNEIIKNEIENLKNLIINFSKK